MGNNNQVIAQLDKRIQSKITELENKRRKAADKSWIEKFIIGLGFDSDTSEIKKLTKERKILSSLGDNSDNDKNEGLPPSDADAFVFLIENDNLDKSIWYNLEQNNEQRILKNDSDIKKVQESLKAF
jgi:hypothetical protein